MHAIIYLNFQLSTIQDHSVLEPELDAWMRSLAGQDALTNGIYYEDRHELIDVNSDHLVRLFPTKLLIEAAKQLNSKATFSVNTPFLLMTSESLAV